MFEITGFIGTDIALTFLGMLICVVLITQVMKKLVDKLDNPLGTKERNELVDTMLDDFGYIVL